MKRLIYLLILPLAAIACQRDDLDVNFGDATPFIAVEKQTYPIGNDATGATIPVSSNVWWTVEVEYPQGTAAWISGVSPEYTNATRELEFDFQANLSKDSRSATITLKPKRPTDVQACSFTIVQAPSDPFINVESDNMVEDSLLLGVVGDDCLLEILTNYDWRIDNTNAPWVTFEPSSGVGDVEAVRQVVCSFPSNLSGQVLSGTVTVVAGDMQKTLKVRQDDTFSKSTLTVENGETFMARWSAVVGAASYSVVIKDGADAVLDQIQLAPTVTEYDLAAYFATAGYSGAVSVGIQATSSDPGIYSQSDPVATNSHFADGSGDGSGPGQELLISSCRHLENITPSGMLDKYFRQTVDLDMDKTTHLPIGNALAGQRFTGSYDGGSKTISNLHGSVSGVTLWGLFGMVEGGVVKGITFSNCDINMISLGTLGTGVPQGVGFAVGANYGGLIEEIHTVNCRIELNKIAGAIGIGSIAGSNANGPASVPGVITGCTATGGQIATASVDKAPLTYVVGGIVGIGNPGSRVEQCANVSTLIKSRGATTGGVAGQNCTVIKSYNKADIEGATNTGGVLGKFDAAGDGEVINCYNTGDITYRYGNAAYFHGGITGTINTAGQVTIAQCFNSGKVEAVVLDRPNLFGGIVARTVTSNTVLIRDCFNTGSVISPCVDASKTSNSGGIVGDVADGAVTIRNCYNVGGVNVGANPTSKGVRAGVIGNRKSDNSTLTGLYYLSGTAEGGVAIGGTATGALVTDVPAEGKSSADLSQQAVYGASWDFDTVWAAPSGGYQYPQLRENPYVE